VFKTTGLDLLRGRKGIMLTLVAILPVFLMLIGRIVGMERGGGTVFFVSTVVPIYQYINLIVFIFLGCSVLGDSIGDGTITYDILCPLSRPAIYAGKMLAYLLSSSALLLVAMLCAYLVCMAPFGMQTVSRNLPLLLSVEIMTVASAMVYGSFFTLLSLLLKRAVLIAIILAISIDGFLAYLPMKISVVSIFVHIRNLMGALANEPGFMEMHKKFTIDIPPVHSVLVLVSTWLIYTVVGVIVFRGKQFTK
jgi:ABC-type transport system involved in multi-copper enzyme maturation permease subunit